jgi:hypothetical protein
MEAVPALEMRHEMRLSVIGSRDLEVLKVSTLLLILWMGLLSKEPILTVRFA